MVESTTMHLYMLHPVTGKPHRPQIQIQLDPKTKRLVSAKVL